MGSYGNEIKRLGEDSVRRIVAEQAITDLASIVKELVDNALDAESNVIKVRLFGQGLDIVEVSDDGSGVPPESRPHLAERYATSKISSFEDIYSGTGLTMGFRGEALFSMACVSEKLAVATRTDDEEMAQKVEFLRDGSLDEASVQSIHRKVGTTVAVIQPFAVLPARRADMMRRIRQERTKLFRLMEAYAIFNIGVQLSLIDMSSSGKEVIALTTSASSTKLEETVSSVVGHKFLSTLAPVELQLDKLLQRDENIYNWGVQGLFSKTPRGEMPNRVVNYYSINGRVVDIPKITTLLRRIWNGFGGRKKPSCILSFTLPNDAFDVNLSPDKQQVLLTHEHEICQLIEEYLTQFWLKETQGVFELQKLETYEKEDGDDVENEDGERQMHKRRFAFVHDLAKAKLQHDSEARHRCKEDEEKKQTEPEVEVKSTSTEHDGPEKPPEKKRRVSSPDDDGNRDSGTGTSMTVTKSDRESIPEVRVSDRDRRHWTAIQARFNARDENSEKIQMALVKPDDHAIQEELDAQNACAGIGVGTDSGTKTTHETNPVGFNSRQKQTFLQHFSFKPAEQLSPFRPASENRPPSRRPSFYAETVEISRNSRRKHSDIQGTTRSSTSEENAEVVEHCTPDCSTSETGKVASVTAGGVPADTYNGIDPIQTGESQRRSQKTIRSTERVVWDCFRGTEEVCCSARLERVHMLRRKSKVRSSPSNASGGAEGSEYEARDFTQSVGVAADSRSTSISLSKEQFRHGMEVIGQFNMGFILARCKESHLWILDQHACDEKFNFEKLCRDTVMYEQKLLRPMPLDLSPAEEACILDNMNIFEANGFRFRFDSSAPIRRRLSLSALPHSGAQDGRKAVQFGKDDVSTLCSILMEGSSYDAGGGGTGTDGTGMYGNNAVRRYASTASSQFDNSDKIIARLPKAIAMFASRACRSSIMIGTALSQKEMEKIVRRLADVDHPWNCPHGRPTMRHVGEVQSPIRFDERKAAEYITGPTVTFTPMTQEALLEEET